MRYYIRNQLIYKHDPKSDILYYILTDDRGYPNFNVSEFNGPRGLDEKSIKSYGFKEIYGYESSFDKIFNQSYITAIKIFFSVEKAKQTKLGQLFL